MIKFSCSIAGLVPAIGLQLYTGHLDHLSTYYAKTGSKAQHWGICQECGLPFIYSTFSKLHFQKFCSCSCSRKYAARIHREIKQKLLSKYAKMPEMSEFYKQYNQIVRNYIYSNYEPEYREDLFDYWQKEVIDVFYRIYTYEKRMKRKINRFAFLKKRIEYGFLTVKSKKSKEVFYDECSIKTQYAILGEYNERY